MERVFILFFLGEGWAHLPQVLKAMNFEERAFQLFSNKGSKAQGNEVP